MKLVDAHCHLESEELRGRIPEVLAGARRAGVYQLVTCAVRPEDWDLSESIARAHEEVVCALGVHPWFVKAEDLTRVEDLADARERGAHAIGEIGLDKKIETPTMDLQQSVFEAQLAVAKEINLPVVIHCRGTFDEVLASLRRVGVPEAGGVIHAFSGSVELAEVFIGLGMSFSMGRALTYRNSRKRAKVLQRIYPDHFLLETDSPDMPPVEVAQDEANIPANIVYNLQAAAEILEEPKERVADQTTRNAIQLFGL
jgi:TatD DNase family protein